MTFPQGALRKGEPEMKKNERLSLAFLAAGTLVLALLQTSPCCRRQKTD